MKNVKAIAKAAKLAIAATPTLSSNKRNSFVIYRGKIRNVLSFFEKGTFFHLYTSYGSHNN